MSSTEVFPMLYGPENGLQRLPDFRQKKPGSRPGFDPQLVR